MTAHLRAPIYLGEAPGLSRHELADLVTPNRDPAAAESMSLEDIEVVETIKKGETIYAEK